MEVKKIKVIFDTNVWISFLIGKRLSRIKSFISDGTIRIIICQQILQELKIVTAREKFRVYFPQKDVDEFLDLLESIGEMTEIQEKYFQCRDPKDNFLLDLIDFSRADYLVTGDKDLLELNPFLHAEILSPLAFENQIKRL
jgi:putative PIN family toxin of toxin-antitoxin system